MVNACRKPGEWQAYDILFTAPRFDEAGKLARPGYITVLQNGLVVQNHVELLGATSYEHAPKYEAHPTKSPLHLQLHDTAVRFWNMMIRDSADPKVRQITCTSRRIIRRQ